MLIDLDQQATQAAFGELVGIADFPNVLRALDGFVARPAVIRGLSIPS